MFYLNASFYFDPENAVILKNGFSKESGRYKTLIRDINRIKNSAQLV